MNETIVTLPFVVVRDVAILPDTVAQFDLGRDKSVKAVEKAMLSDSRIFLAAQKDGSREEIPTDPSEICRTGTVVTVSQILKLQNHALRVLVHAESRGRLVHVFEGEEYLRAEVEPLPELSELSADSQTEEAMIRSILESMMDYCAVNQSAGKELLGKIDGLTGIVSLVRVAGSALPLDFERKQRMLEADSIQEQYEILLEFLMRETNVIRIKNELKEKVQQRMDQNQKEYILREQMKAIREELGENEESEADKYEEQLKKLSAPKEIKEQIEKEISRFRSSSGFNAESTIQRTYIETLLSLPWNKTSRDRKDLKAARQILDEDHYGLEEVKKRILEFLAVRNMTKKGSSPIICLVGPPGTGKTSIARSIARALGKKYVRIGLGGVRDEAEIRGHRRTYVGAIPGRIIAAIRYAGVSNPLILLDEIDKTGSDYRGDVASALLELLDSEQNSRFVDHYVELPVDMSEVLFLTTANDRSAIPRPLLDRMEIIEVSSYTANEKMHIAKEHLIAKQREANGLKEDQLSISDAALSHIIEGYTREAGVRGLERKIGQVCRKAAGEIFEKKKTKVHITESNLEKYLGHERFQKEKISGEDDIGVVCGLAWTSVGGTTLRIETNVMPGKGDIRLTGQLGDVMKESAQAGISYIRSIKGSHAIAADYFASHDIHIHIPEGAVPKDGPSAGITMATAIYSAVTEIPVKGDVAMTGEITLRGKVLPIGGLKEKLLAASMAGIHTVCVPEKNRPDVEELSSEITKGLDITYVSSMEEVLSAALAVPASEPMQ
ncbi:MAG: endopeptidase La [Eubacterium sp.]|jgi:ATP-dependent Lon protease